MERVDPEPVVEARAGGSAEGGGGASGPRNGPGPPQPPPWPVVLVSVVAAAAAATAVGCVCALLYPIIKELRAERVRGEDGMEERMLGFWSILVLSVLGGCVCSALSWILTFMNSCRPGMVIPSLLPPSCFRDASGRDFHLDYGVAALNGVMAVLAIIWSLT